LSDLGAKSLQKASRARFISIFHERRSGQTLQIENSRIHRNSKTCLEYSTCNEGHDSSYVFDSLLLLVYEAILQQDSLFRTDETQSCLNQYRQLVGFSFSFAR